MQWIISLINNIHTFNLVEKVTVQTIFQWCYLSNIKFIKIRKPRSYNSQSSKVWKLECNNNKCVIANASRFWVFIYIPLPYFCNNISLSTDSHTNSLPSVCNILAFPTPSFFFTQSLKHTAFYFILEGTFKFQDLTFI